VDVVERERQRERDAADPLGNLHHGAIQPWA
jgi:hypothetical protein